MDLPTGQRSRGVVLSPTKQAKLPAQMHQLDIDCYTAGLTAAQRATVTALGAVAQ